MKAAKEQIDNFLKAKKIAIAGVSKDKRKFGYQVFNHLIQNGFEVIPINPNHDEIYGISCLKSVDELPNSIDSLLILTPKTQTDMVLKMAINKNIANIWIQQFSETNDSFRIAEKHSQNIIFKKCIFMFAEPVSGFHKFHRNVVRLFGKYPK